MNNNPFFSIIVVCYNAENSIAATIESTLNQSCDDFEIVVKDGLSTDKTLEQIPNDSRIRIYSEKDSGIYDAMNQATAYASGKFIIYMNCGDLFYDSSVLEKVKAAIGDEDDICVYGNNCRDGYVIKQAIKITDFALYRSPICHQSIFFASKLLNGINTYDTEFRVDADYDLEVRLHKSNAKFLYVDLPICRYEGGGFSETGKGAELLKKEKKIIREKYFTSRQRFKFELKYKMTFPKLRALVRGKGSPAFIKKAYRKLADFYYKKFN